MEPINFPEANTTFGENQPQYKTLYAFHNKESKEGVVVSCWKLSFKERLQVLFGGKLWLSMMTFNNSPHPILPTTDKWEIFIKPKSNGS